MAYKLVYNPFTDNFDMVQGGLSIPQTGWLDPASYTPDKYFDASSTSVTELANVLATLIVTLKTAGILSAPDTTGEPIGLLLALTYA